ncbi:ArsR/SmtB family transcription factor [Palaeococcus ferrophilus]|uniref:ArsR/SmtB family transcription factor n=1 Tax=Palaeococcus ferrophilus TaxID=83868 RepID=UPI00064EADB4|nr:winged helix-turn-helix domain-containing protein [Palaeococcus ferrophilus]
MVEFETIDVGDEKAKELAQIIVNDKAIAILRLLQEKSYSASEISEKLGMPLSTVVYHLDKMSRVGLVEVVGKRYGKRLQEVKLYRASPRPILLLPAKTSFKKRLLRTIEKIQVISLSIAGLISYAVYRALAGGFGAASAPPSREFETMTTAQVGVDNASKALPMVPNTTTSLYTVTQKAASEPRVQAFVGALLAFIVIALLLHYYLSRRNL